VTTDPKSPAAYRELLYERYAEANPIMASSLSEADLHRQGQQLKYYHRGWLPDRKDAAIFELGSAYGRLLNLLKSEGYTSLTGSDVGEDQVLDRNGKRGPAVLTRCMLVTAKRA
jgi:hypothetical protein